MLKTLTPQPDKFSKLVDHELGKTVIMNLTNKEIRRLQG